MKIYLRQPLGFSEIGRKDNQEDCVYPPFNSVTKDQNFFILCDGMGGHENGEVASALVSESLGHYFELHTPANGIVTTELFNDALASAYDALDDADNGESLKKMGTTMTCLYLHRGGYLVAHIGDSRIYHIHPTSSKVEGNTVGIRYQSSDHSLVNDLLKAGELTDEEAINFPQKNVITRAMQPHLSRRYKADIYTFSDVDSGDYFFLCSDGIVEQLTNQRLCEILADSTLGDKEKLAAIKAECDGKTIDNNTCWLIPVDEVEVEHGDVEDKTAEMTIIVDAPETQKPIQHTRNYSSEAPTIPANQPHTTASATASKKKPKIQRIIIFAVLMAVAASVGYFLRGPQTVVMDKLDDNQETIVSLKDSIDKEAEPATIGNTQPSDSEPTQQAEQ